MAKIKPKKFYTVYKTTNKINKKIYIGFHSTNDLDDGYLGSGKLIIKAVEKYGPENFEKEILAVFDNKADAEKLEAELVNKEFVQERSNYNLSLGGNVLIMTGKNHYLYGKTWEEAIGKEKADELRRKGALRMKDFKHSTSSKEKISQSIKKIWDDPEYKHKMSEKRKCYKHPEYVKEKISLAHKGKTLSEEHKLSVSIGRKKMFEKMTEQERITWYENSYTEERNAKISKALTGKSHAAWQDKINKNPEKIRKTAEKHRGMKRSNECKEKISSALKGRRYFYHPDHKKRKRCVPGTEPEGWLRVNPK